LQRSSRIHLKNELRKRWSRKGWHTNWSWSTIWIGHNIKWIPPFGVVHCITMLFVLRWTKNWAWSFCDHVTTIYLFRLDQFVSKFLDETRNNKRIEISFKVFQGWLFINDYLSHQSYKRAFSPSTLTFSLPKLGILVGSFNILHNKNKIYIHKILIICFQAFHHCWIFIWKEVLITHIHSFEE